MITMSVTTVVVIIVLSLAMLFLFSIGARRGIVNFLTGFGYLFHTAMLVVWSFIRRFWWILLIIAGTGIILFVGLAFIATSGIVAFGSMIGMREIAFLLVVLVILGFILSFFRITGPIRYWVIVPMITIACLSLLGGSIWWMFGQISPTLHSSYTRYSKNKVQEIAFRADKASVHSEPEQAIWGIVTQDGTTYNAAGQPVEEGGLKKGTRVKLCDLQGKPASEGSEGLVCVMFPNKYGDYIDGNRRWIPSRKVTWQKTAKEEEEAKAVNGKEKLPPPPPPVPPQAKAPEILPHEFQPIETVWISGEKYGRGTEFFKGRLPAGRYKIVFDPVEAGKDATILVVTAGGQTREKKIIDGFFTIDKGEEGCTLMSVCPGIARIYA